MKHKWTKRQLAALDHSIEEKWIPIWENGGIEHNGTLDCKCCDEFWSCHKWCGRCPIHLFDGSDGNTCCNGLFSEWYDLPEGPKKKRASKLIINYLRRVRRAGV